MIVKINEEDRNETYPAVIPFVEGILCRLWLLFLEGVTQYKKIILWGELITDPCRLTQTSCLADLSNKVDVTVLAQILRSQNVDQKKKLALFHVAS